MNPFSDLDGIAARWADWVWPAAWQSAIGGGLLLALVCLGRRWPAPVRSALLLVALIKFAMPPFWPFSPGLFGTAGPSIPRLISTSAFINNSQSRAPALPIQFKASEALEPRPTIPGLLPQNQSASLPARSPAISKPALKTALMLTHLSGALAVLGWVLIQMVRLRFLLQRAKPVLGGPLLSALETSAEQLRIRRLPRLFAVDAPCSPMAFGFWRPAILMPATVATGLSRAEIRMVFAHELAHFHRGDLLVNWAQILLLALWWFHPVFWLVNRELRKVREDCCDDLLLARGLSGANEYCAALVRAARELANTRPVGAALGFGEHLHPLGRRITRLMDDTIPRRPRLSLSAFGATLALALAVLPGLKSQETIPETKPQPDARIPRAGTDRLKSTVAASRTNSPVVLSSTNSIDHLFERLQWFRDTVSEFHLPYVESIKVAHEIGPAGVPLLIEKLQTPKIETNESVDIRRKAAWALGKIGPAAKPAVPALIQALSDHANRAVQPDGIGVIDERVSVVAARALGEIGPEAKEAIPALIQSLQYGVGTALPALAKIAPDSPATLQRLTAALDDFSQGNFPAEWPYRLRALSGLGLLAEHQSQAIASVQTVLTDPLLGASAVKILLETKRFEEAAQQAVERGWKEGSLMDRAEVAASLAKAGRRSPELFAVVLQRLKERPADLSESLVEAIGYFGEMGGPATPYLSNALAGSSNPSFRQALIHTLGWIGHGDETAARALARCLTDHETENRTFAIYALGNVGPAAHSIAPEILARVHDPLTETRAAALSILGKIKADPITAIPILMNALQDPEAAVRSGAVTGLGDFGADARAAVEKMAELLADADGSVAGSAASALGRLGPGAAAAVPALIKALPKPGMGGNVAWALGKIGQAARPAIPALEQLLDRSDGIFRCNVAFALWRIDGRTDVVPILIARLETEEVWDPLERLNVKSTRLFTMQQLGEIGSPAQAAVPVLKQTLTDRDPDLRQAARKALDKITVPPASR